MLKLKKSKDRGIFVIVCNLTEKWRWYQVQGTFLIDFRTIRTSGVKFPKLGLKLQKGDSYRD